MKTIETIAHVAPDGKLTLQLPADIPAGDHKIVLVIDEVPLSQTESSNERGNAWDVLKNYVGTVKDMPEDWAIEHDHYLYGTPKHSLLSNAT